MPEPSPLEPEFHQLTVRADLALVAAIDREADRLRSQTSGVRVTRSDAIRNVLARVLLPVAAPVVGSCR